MKISRYLILVVGGPHAICIYIFRLTLPFPFSREILLLQIIRSCPITAPAIVYIHSLMFWKFTIPIFHMQRMCLLSSIKSSPSLSSAYNITVSLFVNATKEKSSDRCTWDCFLKNVLLYQPSFCFSKTSVVQSFAFVSSLKTIRKSLAVRCPPWYYPSTVWHQQ
jgi:hypothetical protein